MIYIYYICEQDEYSTVNLCKIWFQTEIQKLFAFSCPNAAEHLKRSVPEWFYCCYTSVDQHWLSQHLHRTIMSDLHGLCRVDYYGSFLVCRRKQKWNIKHTKVDQTLKAHHQLWLTSETGLSVHISPLRSWAWWTVSLWLDTNTPPLQKLKHIVTRDWAVTVI